VSSYAKADWREHDRRARTGWGLRAVYSVARPWLGRAPRRLLSEELLRATSPDLVLFDRGFPLEHRRRWATRGLDVRGSTLLIQGTGTGWDVVSWAELRPRRIVATDLFDFSESWEPIREHCRARYGVEVTFHAAPLEDHAFLADASIDLCASDAVLEHCVDLDAVLAETARVLRPGGRFYASYGPLWYAPGGDHFSGRGGREHVYNHVLLDPPAYRAYFEAQRRPEEDFQSGGRYVELDLFSKMTTRDYLAAFARQGFERDGLVLFASRNAAWFRLHRSREWGRLVHRIYPRASPDDLMVWAHLARLTKPR